MTGEHDSQPRKTIALIGYRGSGKTTIGRAIAAQLSCSVVDTDHRVVERVGKSIAAIFTDESEAAFRAYESQAIQDALDERPGILSVGGGAVLDPQNVRLLRKRCYVVWLTATSDVLWERISADESTSSSRPALSNESGLDEVKKVLATREVAYRSTAHAMVDTVNRQPEQIAMEIIALASAGSDS